MINGWLQMDSVYFGFHLIIDQCAQLFAGVLYAWEINLAKFYLWNLTFEVCFCTNNPQLALCSFKFQSLSCKILSKPSTNKASSLKLPGQLLSLKASRLTTMTIDLDFVHLVSVPVHRLGFTQPHYPVNFSSLK